MAVVRTSKSAFAFLVRAIVAAENCTKSTSTEEQM